jgi:hypothetical protein
MTLAALAANMPANAGDVWHFNNYKRCTAQTEFKVYKRESIGTDLEAEQDKWPLVHLARKDPTLGPRGGPAPSVLEEPDTASVTFQREHLAQLEAVVRFLKKCRPWFWDRNIGKAVPLGVKIYGE